MTVSRNWLKGADAIILSPSFQVSADKIWDWGSHCHDSRYRFGSQGISYGTPIPILFLALRAFLQKTPLKGIPLTSCLAPSPRSYGPKKGLLCGLKRFLKLLKAERGQIGSKSHHLDDISLSK
jgi:hypothetical protein